MDIRNIAIIAHVDHGKTALTDAIMRQTGVLEAEGGGMDSNALEQERGITIYSKNTAVYYKDTKINIVDTPGHADFGSEVERVLRSIDSVLLVVDAQEGPMPQTRFVLKKSLELGLKPIVVLNKIDKPAADPDMAQEKVFELFLDLGATDEQLDFTTIYSIGKDGIAKKNLKDESLDLTPLLDTIISEVEPAENNPEKSFLFQPFNLGYDDFLGRLAIGRIYQGTVKPGNTLFIKKRDGSTETGRVTKLFAFKGTARVEATEASSGDIAMISGFSNIDIGETLCREKDQEPLGVIPIDQPTISLNFMVNDSPFAGLEGTLVTGQQIRERLEKELEVNVGLKVDFLDDSYKVYGRGELHVSILLENMRREGYEVQVSQPQVILREENGEKTEPFEELIVDVPEEFCGSVIEKIGKRKGTMINMEKKRSQTRIVFEIPTRGLMGYRSEFVIDTKGEGILCSRVIGYRKWAGEIKRKSTGSMISKEKGKALGFSLFNLQDRGMLYIKPGTEVYEGMVIGNSSKGDDMVVNPIKGKQLTNMRASVSDDAIQLTPPFELNIERGIEVMAEDEFLEITPKSVRLRKQGLTEMERKRTKRH